MERRSLPGRQRLIHAHIFVSSTFPPRGLAQLLDRINYCRRERGRFDSVRPPGALLKHTREVNKSNRWAPLCSLGFSHRHDRGDSFASRTGLANPTIRIVLFVWSFLAFVVRTVCWHLKSNREEISSTNQSSVCFDNRLVQLSLAFVTYITHQTIHKA